MFTETSPKQKNWFILGYQHRRSYKYTFDSVAGLLSIEKDERLKRTEVGLLFYALNYRHRPGYNYVSLFWHLGGWWSVREHEFSVSLMTIAGYEKTLSSHGSLLLHHRLLPFWWYTTKNHETQWIFPLTLGYFVSRYDKSRFDFLGLGLLYYRDLRSQEESDQLLLLGGLLYSYHCRPERNYRSYGSLWTLLWHYESEEDYNRFTLLKFVLSRTQKAGETYWRILGLKL